jgi:hypothetical protein
LRFKKQRLRGRHEAGLAIAGCQLGLFQYSRFFSNPLEKSFCVGGANFISVRVALDFAASSWKIRAGE